MKKELAAYKGKRSIFYIGHGVLACFVIMLFVLFSQPVGAEGKEGAEAKLPKDPELFSPAYYKAATPDMVRKKIARKNLATLSFPRNLLKGIPEFEPLPAPISNDSENAPIYPLNVALENTPYPAVIAYLLDAGAAYEKDTFPTYLLRPDANPEIGHAYLWRLPAEDRCEYFAACAGGGMKSLVDLVLSVPDMDINCLPEGSWYNAPALGRALKNRQNEMAEHLLGLGADPNLKTQYASVPMYFALLGENAQGALLLAQRGADLKYLQGGKTFLQYCADLARKVTDSELLRVLSDNVPLDGDLAYWNIRAACRLDSVDAVKHLLARGVEPVEGKAQSCPIAGPNNEDIVKLLQEKGFTLVTEP